MNKKIAVFCSAMPVDEKYIKPTQEFGVLMAKNGFDLVWGGTDRGLMKVIAEAVKLGGGKLYGVSVIAYQQQLKSDADEMIVAKTLGERKALFLEKSDAIVCLVGGIGTLDEITEIIELRKQKHHEKPIVILNTENFYEGFKTQLQKMREDRFFSFNIDDFVFFADSPKEAIDYINQKLKS